MAKMTLLEIVQNILSAMDSDEVNSISDTVESFQVATVVKETFEEQFNNIEIPEFRKIIKLTSVSDLNRPNYLKYPSNVRKIEFVKYKDEAYGDKYREVTFLSPVDFFERFVDNSTAGTNFTQVIDPDGVNFYVQKDKQPSYYTSFDDNYLIFDSYNETYDSTMQSSKTFCWGTVEPEFELVDEFIPPIDSNLFPLLLAEAKSTCFINFKQLPNSKEDLKARRQRIRMQNDQYKDRQAEYKKQVEFNYARNR